MECCLIPALDGRFCRICRLFSIIGNAADLVLQQLRLSGKSSLVWFVSLKKMLPPGSAKCKRLQK